MDRKKTNSVTELVKIIAREVIEEHLYDTSFRSTINEAINTKIERHEDTQHKREYIKEESPTTYQISVMRKIAKEVIQHTEEKIKVWAREFLKNELKKQENNSIFETICKAATKCIEGTDNELESIGASWPMEEDVMLREEMDVAINRIAANHGRTTGSIRSRIRQKEVLKSQRREGNE